MNYNNPDPPKTVGVRAKAISSTAPTKREVERLKRLEAKKNNIIKPKEVSKEIVNYFSDETRAARFVKGMGISKIEVNHKKNTIQFELEEEFNHVLSTICSWKKINPEEYLSQLLTEYFLELKNSKG
jgi:hypothetical protein